MFFRFADDTVLWQDEDDSYWVSSEYLKKDKDGDWFLDKQKIEEDREERKHMGMKK
jgi:hypothetical protein